MRNTHTPEFAPVTLSGSKLLAAILLPHSDHRLALCAGTACRYGFLPAIKSTRFVRALTSRCCFWRDSGPCLLPLPCTLPLYLVSSIASANSALPPLSRLGASTTMSSSKRGTHRPKSPPGRSRCPRVVSRALDGRSFLLPPGFRARASASQNSLSCCLSLSLSSASSSSRIILCPCSSASGGERAVGEPRAKSDRRGRPCAEDAQPSPPSIPSRLAMSPPRSCPGPVSPRRSDRVAIQRSSACLPRQRSVSDDSIDCHSSRGTKARAGKFLGSYQLCGVGGCARSKRQGTQK